MIEPAAEPNTKAGGGVKIDDGELANVADAGALGTPKLKPETAVATGILSLVLLSAEAATAAPRETKLIDIFSVVSYLRP